MKSPSVINYCAIPPFRYGKYKWPKLSELHQKLFGTDFEEAHNANVDIQATAKCFWELKRLGKI
jgi:DNA polymerase III alpha subunit (gram-positive type)